jgi:hypothetical protein
MSTVYHIALELILPHRTSLSYQVRDLTIIINTVIISARLSIQTILLDVNFDVDYSGQNKMTSADLLRNFTQ